MQVNASRIEKLFKKRARELAPCQTFLNNTTIFVYEHDLFYLFIKLYSGLGSTHCVFSGRSCANVNLCQSLCSQHMCRKFIERRLNQFCLYKSNAPRICHQSVPNPYFIACQNPSKIQQVYFGKLIFKKLYDDP